MAVPFGHDWSRARDEYYVPLDRVRPAGRRGTHDAIDEASGTQSWWDGARARRVLHRQVLEHLASPDAVLVLIDAEFIKNSGSCVGTYRHTDGPLGPVEHRQRGIFLAYAAPNGEGYLDRELFLPRAWTENESLRLAAGMPADVTYSTCSQMARQMLERALEANTPHRFITGGPAFGTDGGLRLWLEERGEAYMLGVTGREMVRAGRAQLRAEALLDIWPESAWQPAADSAAAARGEVWACVPIQKPTPPGWNRWLLLRRLTWDTATVDYFVAFVPEGTAYADMTRIGEAHRRVAAGLREARLTVGLDRFNGRSWTSWYRHMTVALLAHTMRRMCHQT